MKKLIYYGGEGFYFAPKNGLFEIRTNFVTKKFTNCVKAMKYYYSLNEEKSFWNLTNFPELIDCRVYEK